MTGSRLPVLHLEAGIAAAVQEVHEAWAKAVARQTERRPFLIVAIDGPSGSGKSFLAGPLAAALADALGGSIIAPDVIAPDVTAPDASAPEGGGRARIAVVSTDLLATWEHPFDWWPTAEEHLLRPLAAGRATDLPTVAWVDGEPAEGGVLVIDDVDILVLEGVSSGRRAIADRLAALVWVEVPDAAERLERAVGRDGEASRPYLAQWQRDEERHFRRDGTKDRATVVIDPR